MPPVLLQGSAARELQLGAIPIGRAVLVLAAIIHGSDRPELGSQLPGETFNHRRAFHMTAEQAECVSDAFSDDRIGSAQQVKRFDETRNADHRISAWRGTDLAEYSGQ